MINERELVRIIEADKRPGDPDKSWTGALVSALMPRGGKWLLEVHPDHPAYCDFLLQELMTWPKKELAKAMAFESFSALPAVTREYYKIAFERK